MSYVEDSLLLKKLYDYIKINYDSSYAITDIILDFCDLNGINEETIGEIIKEDAQLADFIKTDCIHKHMLRF